MYKLDPPPLAPLIAISFLFVKAMLWMRTWNTASITRRIRRDWLLLPSFMVLVCLLNQWEGYLPVLSKSPVVTVLSLPGHEGILWSPVLGPC